MDAGLEALPDDIDALKAALIVALARAEEVQAELAVKAVGDPTFDVRRYLERADKPAPSAPEAKPQPIGLRWSISAMAGWFRSMARF